MISITERGKAICVLASEKEDLFKQASVITGQMYLAVAKHNDFMTTMSRQHEVLLNKIAAIEIMEDKL